MMFGRNRRQQRLAELDGDFERFEQAAAHRFELAPSSSSPMPKGLP